ncbi:MAG: DUF4860 domain-containing protein [Bacillota bacterium]|nr:DUF4860 domain-containing protein [Bacillota bacterium]
MKRIVKQQDITTVAALLLLGVFAVCILSVLLTSARAYQTLTERDRVAFEQRTAIQYIATKVRQAPGQIQIEKFGDGNALLIPEEIDGTAYITRIYCHDGWLKELFTDKLSEVSPEDGEAILPARSLVLHQSDALLRIQLTDALETAQLYLSLRCTEGGDR